MIYLASPYTSEDPFLMEERYLRTCKVLCDYLIAGLWTYSPIVHCHELAKIGGLPKDSAFWRDYDFHMIDRSEALHVLRLDGWTTSVGIAEEIKHANRREIPVKYI